MKSTNILESMKLEWVCRQTLMKLETSCIRGFCSHPFDAPWG